MQVKALTRWGGLAVVAGSLMGCVVAPPAPLIALPGENKTYPDFQQDDVACRTVANAPLPGAGQPVASPAAGSAAATIPSAAVAATVAPVDPGLSYVQCMASRGNAVVPLPRDYATAYAGFGYGYPGYGYPGYGGYYPWLYADLVTFGYFGGPGWYGAYGRSPRWYGYGGGGFRRDFGGFRGYDGFGRGRFERGGFERGGFDRGGFGRGGFGRVRG